MNESTQSDRQRVTIVALGSFNPAIFHPVWFFHHGLIREAEGATANVKAVNTEVTLVEFEWFGLQVTAERFVVETRDPSKFLPLRDIVSATFAILEHTPVTAFGFNSYQWFQLESAEAWHQFGDNFAPKAPWTDILDQPGLLTMTIQGTRPSCKADRIQIMLQPGRGDENAIVVSVNEHYDVKQRVDDEPASSNMLVETLDNAWSGFQEYSLKVGTHLLQQGSLPK